MQIVDGIDFFHGTEGQVNQRAGQGGDRGESLPPIVFQAAGPTVASIQSVVSEYRAALGTNNGNKEGQPSGRREINWDGGSTTNLSITKSDNPFVGFQATRGALFTTPDGIGFVQAPPSGLAELFNNPSYATIFTAFSPSWLFSAIGSNINDVNFFVPSGNIPTTTNIPATVIGFGAVFTDVDQRRRRGRHSSPIRNGRAPAVQARRSFPAPTG